MRSYIKHNGRYAGVQFLTILLFAGFILSIQPLQASTSKGGELADKTRVVVLTPEQLSMIKGSRIASFSLAAVSGGRMTPIPYQFDERTRSGYIYMRTLSKKQKEEDPILGMEGFFDEKDELIFMFRDAGPRKRSGMTIDGRLVAEIELTTYNNEKRYVYLMEGSRLESENYYVRYSAALGRIETDYYALKVDPNNAFMWQEFYYDSFDGANPRKPVDTIKMRMTSRAFGTAPVTIDNKNFVARVIAEKSGPIRSTTQYKTTLTYLKTPLLNLDLQIVHHEHEIRYDAITEIPPIRRRLVAAPAMRLSLDGHELYGATIRTKNGPKEPGIVDGEISDIEREMMATPVVDGDDHWMFLDSNYRFALFANFRVESEEPVPMEILYEDEKDSLDRSEYYRGQLPNAGFTIPRIPLRGAMRVLVDLKLFNESPDVDADKFADYIFTAPAVRINKL